MTWAQIVLYFPTEEVKRELTPAEKSDKIMMIKRNKVKYKLETAGKQVPPDLDQLNDDQLKALFESC